MSETQKTRRVLCVEDNTDLCELITELLSSAEVISAAGVKEAWDALSWQNFSLILLDRHLIDGDGLELCERIRENGSHIPIVFITNDHNLTEEEVTRAGAQVLIAKSDQKFIDKLFRNVERYVELNGAA